MSNNPYSDNSFTRFLSGKGFYAVLALCLVGAGTAAWLAVGNTMAETEPPAPQPDKQIAQQLSQAQQWGFPLLEEAGQSQADVPAEIPSRPAPPVSEPPAAQQEPKAEEQPPAAPAAKPSLSFVLPIDGEIFADYSNGQMVKNETMGDWRSHNGIDIKADEGTPVKAVANGVVTAVKSDALWGFVIEIEHSGDLKSIYCGMGKDIPVRKGDEVSVGQQIGTVGHIPAESLLPLHLHFEMKKADKFVSPLDTMNKR